MPKFRKKPVVIEAYEPDAIQEQAGLTCNDCTLKYADGGWADVVVPDEVWADICPECGLLCFGCMNRRMVNAGYGVGEQKGAVRAGITSGPMANSDWKKEPHRNGPA